MSTSRTVRRFASNTPEYYQAFKVFLDHTDQKTKALAWLRAEVDALPRRETLIDAGAGTGQLTAYLLPSFRKVVAIEPNPTLEADLRATCPTATVLASTILDAAPGVAGDFILCSHVFYYIPFSSWKASFYRLLDWLAPGGVLAVTIQNPETDCMQMLAHFLGARFDLRELRRLAMGRTPTSVQVSLDTVNAHIETADLATACTIAEFMLNLLPMDRLPSWDDVERYVDCHFRQASGGYRFSCHQDFLRVQA